MILLTDNLINEVLRLVACLYEFLKHGTVIIAEAKEISRPMMVHCIESVKPRAIT